MLAANEKRTNFAFLAFGSSALGRKRANDQSSDDLSRALIQFGGLCGQSLAKRAWTLTLKSEASLKHAFCEQRERTRIANAAAQAGKGAM